MADDKGTRQRLLEAGAKVFAERGYRDATIAEICREAGANIASVNYHFRDKAGLYGEVWRDSFAKAIETYPLNMSAGADASPEARLQSLVCSILSRTMSKGPEGVFARLQIREMAEPTSALGPMVREALIPQRQVLVGIVRELLGAGATEKDVEMCVYSVVSQSLFFHISEGVRRQLPPDSALHRPELESLVEHITSFSLAGIGECRRRISGGQS